MYCVRVWIGAVRHVTLAGSLPHQPTNPPTPPRGSKTDAIVQPSTGTPNGGGSEHAPHVWQLWGKMTDVFTYWWYVVVTRMVVIQSLRILAMDIEDNESII